MSGLLSEVPVDFSLSVLFEEMGKLMGKWLSRGWFEKQSVAVMPPKVAWLCQRNSHCLLFWSFLISLPLFGSEDLWGDPDLAAWEGA